MSRNTRNGLLRLLDGPSISDDLDGVKRVDRDALGNRLLGPKTCEDVCLSCMLGGALVKLLAVSAMPLHLFHDGLEFCAFLPSELICLFSKHGEGRLERRFHLFRLRGILSCAPLQVCYFILFLDEVRVSFVFRCVDRVSGAWSCVRFAVGQSSEDEVIRGAGWKVAQPSIAGTVPGPGLINTMQGYFYGDRSDRLIPWTTPSFDFRARHGQAMAHFWGDLKDVVQGGIIWQLREGHVTARQSLVGFCGFVGDWCAGCIAPTKPWYHFIANPATCRAGFYLYYMPQMQSWCIWMASPAPFQVLDPLHHIQF